VENVETFLQPDSKKGVPVLMRVDDIGEISEEFLRTDLAVIKKSYIEC
jgi:hypothetical protein